LIETPEDVDGVLELCHVLIKDQPAATLPAANGEVSSPSDRRAPQMQQPMAEDMAEEQGWVSRMIHLFKCGDLDVQYEVREPDGHL
jgi:vacuolar protein sorting-associated protein 35